MTNKRFTIKPQDDLFGVVDNYSADKVCVINGIRTEIEAEWLCDLLNELNDENQKLKKALCERNVAEQRRREYDEFWNEKIKNMV